MEEKKASLNRLFSYTIPIDDGSAPNPFYEVCTLAICKPRIRSVAKIGDWIAGLGGKNVQNRDLSGHLVYAMRIDEVLTLSEYDQMAPQKWPKKIPNIKSLCLVDRLGDCIYDYSSGQPKQRPSVHREGNIQTDLSGKNVLISYHFFYFGSRAIPLPEHLKPICHQTSGHKSTINAPYFEPFVDWIENLGKGIGQIHGWPDFIIDWEASDSNCACFIRQKDDEEDKEVGN